ncbi:sterile alpha motif domain-containing 12 isoform X1 [Brachionus plicatilis]|uniref:Sterile alpha motif domain-containing 12 isoform X1 n=1 Tax=Brachionus plicatilis TaxID=10195 RepID=A0A3M7RI97_BRAPC|nr:sterile alpha motif domain-containing 12 isoform X1 [Brachionus plicatilis]
MNSIDSEVTLSKEKIQEASKYNENGLIVQSSNSYAVNKWNVDKVLEWLNKKFPSNYENYKDLFILNQITGEALLELNSKSLSCMNIIDKNFREQILLEISLLRIRNEYEFIRRFRTQSTN